MNDRLERGAGKPQDAGADHGSTLPDKLVELANRADLAPGLGEAVPIRPLPKRPQFEFDDEPDSNSEAPAKLPFDPARLVDALMRHWFLWVNAGLFCAAAVCYWYLSKPHTMATMQLIRRDPPMLFRASDTGEAFKPQQFTDQTITTLARSPELFQRISARTEPRISVGKLGASLFAAPERDTELLTLMYKGPQPAPVAVNLLNIFAEELVRFTQEMQMREGQEVVRSLGEKLATVETNLVVVEGDLQRIPPEMKFTDPDRQTEAYLVQLSELDMKYELARIDMNVNDPAAEKLQAARDELASLLVRYTEAHPLVQDQQARVAALEKQLAATTNLTATGIPGNLPPGSRNRLALKQLEEVKALRQSIHDKLNSLSKTNLGYAFLKSRHQSLEMLRTTLMSRQREAQLYAQNALGYYRISQPAGLERAVDKINWRKLIMFALAAAFMGSGLAAGAVLLVEVVDSRIRTIGDLERVTELPVLATLGDLSNLTPAQQEDWAFRTWTILSGKISENRDRALVCGIISARHEEGRSTWIRLLAKTAHQRGLRVLVAAAKPSPMPPVHPHEHTNPTESAMSAVNSVIAFPFQAAQHLSDPKSHPIVHIPLPGWVWNLERRQQWQTALGEWMKIENLVFLVELPPASEAEAVLLAQNLPQLIWLSESGKATMDETRQHLETLRHAGCNLVGSVLNREAPSFYKKHLSRWLGAIALMLALGSNVSAQTATSGEAVNAITIPTNALATLPIIPAAPSPQRAQWQRSLTLGPGDVLNFSFFGETNWSRSDVAVGMDGRVSYLQAQVVAAGLTVDQLREALNKELAKYYRAPHVMVSPVSYRSKKYYVLGRVVTKGAYVLDRPVTILEAVTRARGLETGLAERNVVDLADLQRSFLLRQGVRVAVDFEKLFQQGDFSQNVLLEPDDFLYFAPATLKEVYVLGEVRAPGITPLIDGSSVVGVIAERGGFTDIAFKRRVLVIRGSLEHPQAFAVNTWAVLDARQGDFKLQPRDIIFVSRRPFLRAEELLDVGVTSFLQSATTSWTGSEIGPIIKSPFLPKL